MKFSDVRSHLSYVMGRSADDVDQTKRATEQGDAHALTFDSVYRRWFSTVSQWLRALGGPDTDIEDLAQEVFLVVQRKLPAFDGRHLPAWLYRIVQLTLSDHKRRSWFIHLVRKRGSMDEVTELARGNPHDALDQKQKQRLLYKLASQMTATRRETFLLYEVVGLSGEEIAELHKVPVNTVWTRLHAARKQFTALVAAQPQWDAPRAYNAKRGQA